MDLQLSGHEILTAKPTVCIAGFELVLHNGKFIGVTASVSLRLATAAFRTQIGFAATALRCFAMLVQGRQRFVVAWEDQREHDYGWGIFDAILDDPRPIKLPLSPERYTTSTGAARDSWCLQVHLASAFARGVQRNVD